ncbi:hypothetical protein PVA17_08145, partial [Lysinibacillus sp. CNPSo 3705]|uniref:hypothetical protein n=1 Tax=Lysinibacillus sp. CNPSo 3705 TaxID=3028148 RepID=UPI002364A607
SRAMELEKAAACKIQTAASKGCLAFFQNVLYKGYTLRLPSFFSKCPLQRVHFKLGLAFYYVS